MTQRTVLLASLWACMCGCVFGTHLVERLVLSLEHDREVLGRESLAHASNHALVVLERLRVKIVEEDAADTASLVAAARRGQKGQGRKATSDR